jgi:hypothetical protein
MVAALCVGLVWCGSAWAAGFPEVAEELSLVRRQSPVRTFFRKPSLNLRIRNLRIRNLKIENLKIHNLETQPIH